MPIVISRSGALSRVLMPTAQACGETIIAGDLQSPSFGITRTSSGPVPVDMSPAGVDISRISELQAGSSTALGTFVAGADEHH